MPKPQNFENRVRYVPGFQLGVLGLLTINLGWSFARLGQRADANAIFGVLLAVALVLLALYTRRFALVVQNRIIRLEMRLRLAEVLPPELRRRIPEISLNQLIALRFASDAELPGLITRVLAERLDSRVAIMRLVTDWQPDELRA